MSATFPQPAVFYSRQTQAGLMINKKVVGLAAIAALVAIVGSETLVKLIYGGQADPTAGAVALESVVGLLGFPVVIYNHFTHANDGPINAAQVALIVISALTWGLIIEHIARCCKRQVARTTLVK